MASETRTLMGIKANYKLAILGNCQVGKTSILTQFISSDFNERYWTTIGVGFLYKTFQLEDGLWIFCIMIYQVQKNIGVWHRAILEKLQQQLLFMMW
ncbi:unnamed protein product [Blepharisma stoltei]|uniref:Uncharacterized protein n=1 Tax=Blepharisma stoltei TaxID=1481888 RepID=A0AAU9JJJ6_9CILI|nr:unnamed protein product [Blepharisma stoltei]